MHGAEVETVGCPAIEGPIQEAGEVAGEIEDKAVLDAALIHAGRIEGNFAPRADFFRRLRQNAVPETTRAASSRRKVVRQAGMLRS